MRKLLTLLLIYSQVSYAGLPPTSVKGQSDAASVTKFNFQTPFSQNTDLGGISSLIETGNSNILPNPGFEANTLNWTTSGSGSVSKTAGSKGTGAYGIDWDDGLGTGTSVSPSLITIPEGFKGKNGVLSCDIKLGTSGTITQTMTVNNGTIDVVSPQLITANTSTFTRNTINFIFPSSGSIKPIFYGNDNADPNLYIDDCRLGLADNIGTVQQARLIGTVKITGCSSAWTTTSTSFASFATQTGCSYSVTGDALAPLTNIPGVRFASLPPGEYKFEYEGALYTVATAGRQDADFQVYDGTNQYREVSTISGTTVGDFKPNFMASFSYAAPQSNITLEVRSRTSNSQPSQINGTTARPGVIRVYYFPSSSQQAYNPSLDNWKVDANISGANPSLGTASVSTYTGIENASLTLTNNTGSGNLTAQIPCSSTNSPTGTTCSVGNESVGVSFNLPKAGDVLACASFTHILNISSGSTTETAFQIVETPNNAQTISQQSKSRTHSRLNTGTAGVDYGVPYRTCGTFTFDSSGQKTLRLMYEQAVIVGTTISSIIAADASSATGQRDIHWEIYPITQNVPAPILVGSVTSNSSGAERIERVTFAGNSAGTTICNSSPCTIVQQSGSWVSSVTRSSTGVYNINISSPFTAIPDCTIDAKQFSGLRIVTHNKGASSTSLVQINAYNTSSTLSDDAFTVICAGPR